MALNYLAPAPYASFVTRNGCAPLAFNPFANFRNLVDGGDFSINPTVTVAAGAFKTNQAGTATKTTITVGATHTPNTISINGNSAGTAGQATLLQGGGGSGWIIANADF